MNVRPKKRSTAGLSRRTLYAGGALLALLAGTAGLCSGCEDQVAREFRGAAIDSIEAGLKSIADGVLTGIFTIADPNGADTTDPNAAATTGA